jgi:hypothetical protein
MINYKIDLFKYLTFLVLHHHLLLFQDRFMNLLFLHILFFFYFAGDNKQEIKFNRFKLRKCLRRSEPSYIFFKDKFQDFTHFLSAGCCLLIFLLKSWIFKIYVVIFISIHCLSYVSCLTILIFLLTFNDVVIFFIFFFTFISSSFPLIWIFEKRVAPH